MKIPRIFIRRIFVKSGPPIHLIWFITAKCNLRCSHCFYYSQILSNKDELSFHEISKTISNLSPMLSVSLTGGEPFLRKDLCEIIKLFTKKRLTENLLLFTNGFDTETILTMTEKILSSVSNTNIHIGVSIDGYEAEHDKYRNKEGAYKKTISTLKELKKMKGNFTNLNLGVGITLHSGNQNIIHDFRKDFYNKFEIRPGVIMIRGDVKQPNLKDVDLGKYRETIDAIEHERRISNNKTILQSIIDTRTVLGQKLAYKTFVTHSRSYDCYAGSLMGIIYENGDVYPCEMLKDSNLGNLRNFDYDIKKIWNSPKAKEVRKRIKHRRCYCTYECQYTCNTLYNLEFSPIFAINILKGMIKNFTKNKSHV